jgi:nucleoside 2-deoxyribosyltransferase
MIADFTRYRGGVYFEAGYAQGLGKQVIFTCKRGDSWKENLHFDVEHYPFITWENESELFEKLRDHIGGTILRQDEV